jgi:thiamine biosynthesis lipoprotein
MGTVFRIEVYASSREAVFPAVQAAWRRVHEINRAASDYDPDSELSRFCRQPAGTRVPLSPDLRELLRRSQELSALSGGAFDATVGPLKRLWRQARRDGRLPAPEAREEARGLVGHRLLHLHPDGTASLGRDGMRLDLGGIAKGYAADAALRLLADHGFPRALVAASGDIVVGEAPPGEPGWRVGASSVAVPDGAADHILVLRHQALSTSGDTYQHAEIQGVRYSHIVDPATGLGLTVRRSVNVLAPSSSVADSLATALSVAGPGGFPLPDGVAARCVERAGDDEAPVRVTCLGPWPGTPLP